MSWKSQKRTVERVQVEMSQLTWVVLIALAASLTTLLLLYGGFITNLVEVYK